jgi:hypothetical protein
MRQLKRGIVLLVIAQFACSSLSQPATPSLTLEAATETPAPIITASPAPAPTPTESMLDLEVLEWAVYPYANPADPQNTDTHLEMLVRNPNAIPVRVNTDAVELRLLNAAGEVVYTNPNPTFYLWQGSWMREGETVPISACICFETDGVAKQAWESVELVAPLEAATDIAYTTDVQVKVGKFSPLQGGDTPGAEVQLANTSDQVLESIPLRVLARDASGRYVGVAMFGNAVASFTENISIKPGDTASGIVVSDIDYIDANVPLTYEVTAIGILKK